MTKLATLFAAAALLAPAAAAQNIEVDPATTPPLEDLKPEPNLAFAPGERFLMTQLLLQKLPDVDARGVRLAMVAQSGLNVPEPDYAVMLKGDRGSPYAIMADVLAEPLQKRISVIDLRRITGNRYGFPHDEKSADVYAVNLKKILRLAEERTRDLDVKRCEVSLDKERGARIRQLWQVMLLGTRYEWPGNGGGWDYNVDYHFAGSFDCGLFCGTAGLMAHIVSPGSGKPGMLVHLGETMRDYCLSKDEKDLARLDDAVNALAKRIPRLPEEE